VYTTCAFDAEETCRDSRLVGAALKVSVEAGRRANQVKAA
jgi:hypothetical protein